VFVDPPLVGAQCQCLLRRAAPGKHVAGFGIDPVRITELRNGLGLPLGLLLCRRIGASGDLAKNTPCFNAGAVRSSRRAVPADAVAIVATLSSA
jgi:hypothetical protein